MKPPGKWNKESSMNLERLDLQEVPEAHVRQPLLLGPQESGTGPMKEILARTSAARQWHLK